MSNPKETPVTNVTDRLNQLRKVIESETISYGELIELQGLGEDGLIPEGDVLLLQWAGVPEFPEDDESPADESPEEVRFRALHDELFNYIHHRIPGDEDRAEDVYQEVIDLVIGLTE